VTSAPVHPPSGTPAGTRERLAGVVQAVGRRSSDIERRSGESATVLLLFTAVYAAVGYWLVVRMHVVGFDTLDRFARSLTVLHDDPATLSAVGFDDAPLSVLLLTPLTAVPALARSLVVVPLASAFFAGVTMTVLNTMMRRARLSLGLRAVVLVALGLNPLVVMYASIGAPDFLWLALVVSALGALVAWYVTADIRFVMLAGLLYAVAALTGYSSLLWFLVSLVMVAAILARLGADGREIEGTTVGLASPTVYVVVVWSALNALLLSDPFGWVTAGGAGGTATADLSAAEILGGTVDLVVRGAPIALVVLPALLVAGVARRNGFALWLGALVAVSVVAPGLGAALGLTDSPLAMSNALPILLTSVVGGVWLARSAVGSGAVVAAALAAGLLLSAPWTFASMPDFERQGLERAFHDAVSTGDDQEGAATLDGGTVGFDNELDMATWIRANVPDDASVLTDDAATSAVVLLTGTPATFVERADDDWETIADDPAARVDYLLLSTDTGRDALSARHPEAVLGLDPSLPVAHDNRRYTLVAVPSTGGEG
jgi:hypothetical protein